MKSAAKFGMYFCNLGEVTFILESRYYLLVRKKLVHYREKEVMCIGVVTQMTHLTQGINFKKLFGDRKGVDIHTLIEALEARGNPKVVIIHSHQRSVYIS